MFTTLDCLPCFVSQANTAIALATPNPQLRERAYRSVLKLLSEIDLSQSPPATASLLNRLIRDICNNPDPYLDIKRQSNEFIMKLMPVLRQTIESAPDPVAAAIHLAIGGNLIDYGINHSLNRHDIQNMLDTALLTAIKGVSIAQFQQAVHQANKILYLADNCGEIFLDRLLIECLPYHKITLAVRHSPVLNDATLQDARLAGLDQLVTIIDNGSDAPGTVLENGSETFRQYFHDADLIISKGQGNYETLCHTKFPIFFLFMVKCEVVARYTGFPLGSSLLITHKNT